MVLHLPKDEVPAILMGIFYQSVQPVNTFKANYLSAESFCLTFLTNSIETISAI